MSLLGDAENPKVAFESVDLKENNENGKVLEVGKEEPWERCSRLFRENKILVFLICLIIIGIAIGLALGVLIGKDKRERIVKGVPTDYRLPGDVVPTHYVLEVQPYLIPDNFTFEGKVKILVTCVSETDKVILHSKNLTIVEQEVKVLKSSHESIKVLEIGYDEIMDFLILYLSENMKKGKDYVVFLSFRGVLQDKGKGFYVSYYVDDNNFMHYVASTQYEAIHAREGFPCFDEPALKATFEITLVRWRNMSSLSNMPRVKTERRENNWVADTFLTTLKMSTYIVAYYIGEYVGKVDKKVTAWAPKHKVEFVDYSLDLANKLLPFYEKQFGIPYAPPKLDMIPVTKLVAAAMENWGLIIYVNHQLLYNADKKSAESRKDIAVTIAHELAHQWFGNLVTPKWWSDIWLSEGMTTYMETLATRHFFPEWNEIDRTITDLYLNVYENDCSNENPVAVWKNVTTRELSIDGEAFGMTTYMKGAMMGRMVHYILGDDNFWRGIRTYLKEYSYGNVEEKDLWRHLTEAQFGNKEIDMQETMWSWTHLSGVPIVTVNRDYDKRTAIFTQRSCKTNNFQFYLSDLWHVPISYITPRNPESNPEIQAWLTKSEMRMKDLPKNDEWILVNGQSIGCYLVNYDRRNWELLAEQLRNNHEVFTADQRYKILADANVLYRLDDISIDVVLDVSSYLGNENVLSVFSYPNTRIIFGYFRDMRMSIYYEYWSEFVLSIIEPIHNVLGWEVNRDEHIFSTILLNMHIIDVLCEIDYQPCVDYGVKKLNETIKESKTYTRISTDSTLCAAVRAGSKDVENLLAEYDGDDKLTLMACSKSDMIIQHIFNVFRNGWNRTYASVIGNLMMNRRHWINYLIFLNNYLEISDAENAHLWLRKTGEIISSKEQKEMFRKVVENHITKIPEEYRKKVEEDVNYWESETEATVKSIGEWLIKRIWAR